ncbi:MAG: S8 family peptidase [Sporichthyaceae bacterium]
MANSGPMDEVLAALLGRHRVLLTPPPHALIRGDRLMLQGADVPRSLRSWAGPAVPAAPGLFRLPLLPGTGADVLSLVADGSGRVLPVHLMQATPRLRGGPADAPEPLSTPLPDPPAPTAVGRAVTVAVLDTGVARHRWFRGRAWFENLAPDRREVLDADRDARLDVLAGHGTFVAGLLAQHAPNAELEVVRLLGSDGVCDELELIAALHRLPPVDLVNLSLGCHTWNDQPSAPLAETVESLDALVVAAAGNDATDRPFWPAALASVVAVGALDASGQAPASFSNHGSWVDRWAVGEHVSSCFVDLAGGTEAFARWSGTSFATPLVVAALARALANGG